MNEDLNVSNPNRMDEIEKLQPKYILLSQGTNWSVPGGWTEYTCPLSLERSVGNAFTFADSVATCNYTGLVHILTHVITYPATDINTIRITIHVGNAGIGGFQHSKEQGNHLDEEVSWYKFVQPNTQIYMTLASVLSCVCYYRMLQIRYVSIEE